MGAKKKLYSRIHAQLDGLLSGETDAIANAANMAALLFLELENINWAGFYIHKNGELVLGPFHGNPACVRIAMGKGVCGTAAESRETLVIDDVSQFAEHIACDSASQAEIVIPLIENETLWGVLDIDSPLLSRFDGIDRQGLEAMADLFIERSDLSASG